MPPATVSRLGHAALFLPSVLLAAMGLLIGACSIWMLVEYEATTVENDTPNLRAFCQDANSLKPEGIIIGPGEQKLAHGGISCPVFDVDGAYVSCIPRGQINAANGDTVLVSDSDTSISINDCPNGTFNPGPLDLARYHPDRNEPRSSEKRGTGYVLVGLFFSVAFVGASFAAGQYLLGRGKT